MTRRDFLVTSSAAAATLVLPTGVFAQGSDKLKIGLIGCGGRGTGATHDCITSSPGMVLWSCGDLFPERVASARNGLKDLKDSIQVTDERAFVGWDAYQKVIASGVDMVILATPPAFRATHLAAAVDAGKHVFMEKPVAVDAEGIRSVFASAEKAKAKKLQIAAGTQRRHDVAYRECIKRLHDGAIGDVVAMSCYWNQGGLWMNPRQPNWSDMEWQLRNWLYFTWLSGDHIVEQHVHNMDVCNWVMKGHPLKAVGHGGRQSRTEPAYGHIFDHFAIEFEYEGGTQLHSFCRQIDGTATNVSERIVGTKGNSNANTVITGGKSWKFEGDRPNPYVEEHKHLIAAIRGGTPINEARQVAESTLTAIMGRMAAYTGQEITWDMALNSQEKLIPTNLSFNGQLEVPPVAIPGKTKFL